MTARRLKKDKRWTLIKFCFFIYVVMVMFAFIWLRNGIVKLKYELGQLESQKTELVRKGGLASAERASLYSVVKIEEIATQKLGMNVPDRERIFLVKKASSPAPYRAYVRSVPDSGLSNKIVFKKNKWRLKER